MVRIYGERRRLPRAGLGGTGWVGGSGAMGGIAARPPGEQVAAESGDADGYDDGAPRGKEEPCGIGEKRVTEGHDGRSITRLLYLSVFCVGVLLPARGGPESPRAGQFKNSLLSPLVIDNEESHFPCHRALLLRGRRRLVHVALHTGFVLGYHLLGLGLLVRGQQLEQLVVNLGLRHRQLGFDLSFL